MSPGPTNAHEVWRGTATELLPLLGERVSETVRTSREWTRGASALGSQLRRINPVLRRRGVEVAWMKGGAASRRLVSILVAPTCWPPPPPPAPPRLSLSALRHHPPRRPTASRHRTTTER